MTDILALSYEESLAHHGVKGMKWGIRKDQLGSVATTSLQIDSNIHSSTKQAATTVANLMDERYGYKITEMKTLGPDHPEYANGTWGYVESTPGKSGGKIYVRADDMRAPLKQAEKEEWFAKGTGTPEAFLSHEASHALFHAEQVTKQGFLGPKTSGGNIKARDKALAAAAEEARKNGIQDFEFHTKVSGYSAFAANREEMEAELFSQYHWGTNPPSFVKVWGQTLHQELGVDGTPFKEATSHG